MISFNIAGTSYQAEEGMTWSEWTESSYNTDGYVVVGGYTDIVNSNFTRLVDGASANNIIVNGTSYTLSEGIPDYP